MVMNANLAIIEPTALARRARRQRRLEAVADQRPALRTDRLTPILSILRAYREEPAAALTTERTAMPTPLACFVERVAAELEPLEAWAAKRGARAHRDGTTIRQALALLREFGRITSLDFSSIPQEERPLLVQMLALEHRFCYAAAGTTRDAFKVEIGRTGAR
jgi:hypothetical protein